MNIIVCNCQGAASKSFMRAAKLLIKNHRPLCFCLLEPKMSSHGAHEVCFRLGFDHWIRVEAVGMSGGIWVLWKEELSVTVTRTNPQFILLKICDHNKSSWDMAVVYASPQRNLRSKLWNGLRKSKCDIQDNWIAIGDFNSVACIDEVSCSETYTEQRSRDFNYWVQSKALVDMGFAGASFTWRRGTNEHTFRGARLDRGLGSVEWLENFPCARITHLPAVSSDHTPLLLSLGDNETVKRRKAFRFQAAWTLHEEFQDVVADAWRKGNTLQEKIKKTGEFLTSWNKKSFGNIHKKKRRLEARLNGIQRKLDFQRHGGLIKLEAKIRDELEEVLYQEELLWYQRSREEWIASGDRNTKYYHAATRIRRVINNIHALKNDNGEYETDGSHLREQVIKFFKGIFEDEGGIHQVSPISKGFPDVIDTIHLSMCRDITRDEVKRALFDMSPYKAPGPDGFHAGFYQRAWNIVGDDITDMVKGFSIFGDLQDGMNDTLLSLIPKVKNPEEVSQLRPLVCVMCNTRLLLKSLQTD